MHWLCRLADVVGNKLRLEEQEDRHRQGQEMTEQLSESAQAIRDASALQQMASQAYSSRDQVEPNCKALRHDSTCLSHMVLASCLYL